MVGSRQAEHESQEESMEEDDIVKSMAIASYGDEPIRRTGGLQARVRVKITLTVREYGLLYKTTIRLLDKLPKR